jgi:hypothetical protein
MKWDAANDLALLKADGRFAPLPISPSRTAQLVGSGSFGQTQRANHI